MGICWDGICIFTDGMGILFLFSLAALQICTLFMPKSGHVKKALKALMLRVGEVFFRSV
jgi:hypothetical protein